MSNPRATIRVAAVALAVILGALVARFGWHVYEWQRYFFHVDHVRATIESFRPRRPPDVPEDQWTLAVDWTSNVICQDFFAPDRDELKGLRQLSRQLDLKAMGRVDLDTLRWVWDECEKAAGGPDSHAIRFRDVKLLTKGTITDERLPDVWSLDRCTGLDLSDTEITDESVAYLKTLKQLQALDVGNTGITDEGSRELMDALPNCRVIR